MALAMRLRSQYRKDGRIKPGRDLKVCFFSLK
jgi:hypothetical protein